MSRTYKDRPERRGLKAWVCFYGSEFLRGSDERARVRQALSHDYEPQPRYATGKFWTD